jgi:PAS domain-containing protein
VTHTYQPEEFAQRYRQKDYQKLQDALNRLITQHRDKRGHVEEELTLELRAKDIEGGDHEWHDFVVVISVLQRDKKGKPSLIIGTKKDVTKKHRLKRLEDERTLRYWTIFYAPEGAIIEFDKDGYLHNINPKACELFQCDCDQIIKQHIHMNDFLHTSFSDLCQTDGYHTIQTYNENSIEMQMKTVRQDDGQLLGIFAFCRQIVAILLLLLVTAQVSAQALKDRYTKQRPVVIACEKNHKPYVFIDDNGKAAGSNIDVIKAVMEQLDVPYTFLLKEYDEALRDFNSTGADIILADVQSFQGKQYVISEDVFGYRRISEDSVSEIHLIGRDRQLIEQIDDHYSRLKQSGEIAEIHARWLHPDQMKSRPVSVMLYIIIGILVLAVVLYLLITIARRHVTRVTRSSMELNIMMYKALHMGNYDVMQYDIMRNRFTNRYGNILPKDGMTLEEYTQRIHPDQRSEFIQKMKNLMSGSIPHFELNKRWNQGTDAEPYYLIFQGHAICERDLEGQPAFIINAVYDVTHDVEEEQATLNLIHKYEVILTNPFTAMAFYDSQHNVIDQNEAMKQLGNISDDKPLQPLYDVDGEISNYFLAVSI